MTIVPPRTGSSALAKPLKIVLDDAANPRGKARAVRREILFKDGSSTKMRTPRWCHGMKQLACQFCRCGNRATAKLSIAMAIWFKWRIDSASNEYVEPQLKDMS